MEVREVTRLIEEDGWYLVATRGSRCVATGETHDQVTRNMYEAIEMHARGLLEDELPVPESHSFAEYVAVPSLER